MPLIVRLAWKRETERLLVVRETSALLLLLLLGGRQSAAAAKYEDVAEQVPGRFYAVQLLRDRTHLDPAL